MIANPPSTRPSPRRAAASFNYTMESGDFVDPTGGPEPLAGLPVHRYSFNAAAGDATDMALEDSIGSAHGVVRGSGGMFTGTRLTIPGGSSASAAYGDLPNGLLSQNSANNGGSGELSIEGWVRVTGNRSWGRILDIGSSDVGGGVGGEVTGPGGGGAGLDYLFYSAQVGGDTATHRLELRNEDPAGGGIITRDVPSPTFDTDVHFVITWDESTGEVVAYENGGERTFMFVDDAMSDVNDVNVWLGRSNWTADQNMEGQFDEIRFYDRVLSPAEVLGNFETGPDQLNGELQIAGELFVDLDATAASTGPVMTVPNAGSLGGVFEPRGGAMNIPSIAQVGGTLGIDFDGNDFLQLAETPGGALIQAPGGLIGVDPTRTVEVWALNPAIAPEETMVSFGRRGGPEGSNMAFNYGNNASFGAAGQWGGGPDIGWGMVGSPAANQWHHLVITYNGATFTTSVYIDGVLANSEVLSASAINTHPGSINLATQIDADGTTPTAGLRGRLALARVRIHDGVLTPEQIEHNYVLEKQAFIDPPPLGPAPLALQPLHRYSFDETAGDATGMTFTDSISGAHGVVLGAGAMFTGSRLSLPGGSSGTQAYGDLPNGMVSKNSVNNGGSGQFSIEGWVRVTGNRTWSRIIDFGSTDVGGVGGEVTGPGGGGAGLDYLFYSAQVGGDTALHRMEVRNEDPAGGGVTTADVPSPTFNTDVHFVITWDESTGEVIAYENGGERGFMFVDDAMSDLNDVNVWLGRSNWTADQNMQGEYDEVRIYNHVLSPGEVIGNFQAGPNQLVTGDPVEFTSQPQDQTVNELDTATFLVAASGLPPISFQWYKDGMPLEGETSLTLSFGPVLPADDGAQFHCVASNFVAGVGHAVMSDVATLTVISDLAPPELVEARRADSGRIEVIFSEPILAADAMDHTKFSVNGPFGLVPLTGAAPGTDPARVFLTSSVSLDCGPYTVTVNGVRDASATQNEIQANTMADFFHFVPGGVSHLYDFNREPTSNATGLPVEDSVGGAPGAVLGVGAVFTGSRVRLPGGGSGSAAYIDLPNGLLSKNSANNGGSGELTFEGWVRVTGNQAWSRIFDFGSSLVGGVGGEVTGPGGGGEGRDYLFLGAQINVDTGSRRMELRNEDPGGGGIATADYSTATFDQDVHFAVTWNESTGDIFAYENGSMVASLIVDDAMSDVNDVNVWLGRSNWTADQNLQGEFDSFRSYGRVLTAEEIAHNTTLGPTHNFGPLSFLNPTADTFELVEPQQEQIRVFVDTQTLFDLNITGSSCLSYESSDPTVVTVDANGVVNAVGTGMATVTTRFAGLEEVLFFSATGLPRLRITQTELGYELRLINAVPGTDYLILRAPEVTGTYDTVVGMGTAPANGVIVVEDANPLEGQAFYIAEAVP